jgi:hypothetical protein
VHVFSLSSLTVLQIDLCFKKIVGDGAMPYTLWNKMESYCVQELLSQACFANPSSRIWFNLYFQFLHH